MDANTGHAFGIFMASVGALRLRLRRRLTLALNINWKSMFMINKSVNPDEWAGLMYELEDAHEHLANL
ncbi:MAG: hypothetical protein Q8K34_21610, partial [Hydrogenophaga sp.]|nr:hypothetical protein [Hydrogenophaga sp.]